jgi:hypothetical protein
MFAAIEKYQTVGIRGGAPSEQGQLERRLFFPPESSSKELIGPSG